MLSTTIAKIKANQIGWSLNKRISSLTKKAELPPTRGVDCNRSGNGSWLRRLVRRHLHVLTLPTDVNQSIVATSEIQATTRSERC